MALVVLYRNDGLSSSPSTSVRLLPGKGDNIVSELKVSLLEHEALIFGGNVASQLLNVDEPLNPSET